MSEESTKQQQDHDLLIRIDEKLKSVSDKLETFSSDFHNELRNLSNQISLLDSNKLDKMEAQSIKNENEKKEQTNEKKMEDHEKRIRKIERWGFGAVGALYALEFVLKMLK